MPSGEIFYKGEKYGGSDVTGGTGIDVTEGNVINHTNSVTAGTAAGTATSTLDYGDSFDIPSVTYDAQGHITAKGTTTLTLPPAAPIPVEKQIDANENQVIVGDGNDWAEASQFYTSQIEQEDPQHKVKILDGIDSEHYPDVDGVDWIDNSNDTNCVAIGTKHSDGSSKYLAVNDSSKVFIDGDSDIYLDSITETSGKYYNGESVSGVGYKIADQSAEWLVDLSGTIIKSDKQGAKFTEINLKGCSTNITNSNVNLTNSTLKIGSGCSVTVDSDAGSGTGTGGISSLTVNNSGSLAVNNSASLEVSNSSSAVVTNGSTLGVSSGSNVQISNAAKVYFGAKLLPADPSNKAIYINSQGSMIDISTGANVIMSNGAQLNMNSGGQANIDEGSQITLHGNSKISLDKGAQIVGKEESNTTINSPKFDFTLSQIKSASTGTGSSVNVGTNVEISSEKLSVNNTIKQALQYNQGAGALDKYKINFADSLLIENYKLKYDSNNEYATMTDACQSISISDSVYITIVGGDSPTSDQDTVISITRPNIVMEDCDLDLNDSRIQTLNNFRFYGNGGNYSLKSGTIDIDSGSVSIKENSNINLSGGTSITGDSTKVSIKIGSNPTIDFTYADLLKLRELIDEGPQIERTVGQVVGLLGGSTNSVEGQAQEVNE